MSVLKNIFSYYSEGIKPRKEFSPGFFGLYSYFVEIVETLPKGPSRLLKLQPALALITGLIGIMLMRSGMEYIPWVITFLVLTFLFIIARMYLLKDNFKPEVARISDFAIQYALCDVLLFVLPFYLESMTLFSPNILFGVFVIALTLIASWDEIYEKLILDRPIISTIYYGMIFFVSLNFILPVVAGLKNEWSLIASSISACFLVLFFVHLKMWKPLNLKKNNHGFCGIYYHLHIHLVCSNYNTARTFKTN